MLLAIVTLAIPAAQADLVGHWTFDEGTGATAYDSSGHGYNGTISNATYTSGVVGTGALDFNGANAYVNVGYHAPLALAGSNYTIAWWMKWAAGSSRPQRIIQMDSAESFTGGYAIWIGDGVNEGITSTHNDGSSTSLTWKALDSSNILSNEWMHMALVFDGSNRNFYVNGQLESTQATTVNVANRGDDVLWFGGLNKYGQYYGGALDDIQIYNQALSSAQIGVVLGGGTIPEPTSMALCATGVLSLLAYAWRRRQ
jgi:hypothetical protein